MPTRNNVTNNATSNSIAITAALLLSAALVSSCTATWGDKFDVISQTTALYRFKMYDGTYQQTLHEADAERKIKAFMIETDYTSYEIVLCSYHRGYGVGYYEYTVKFSK